MIRLRTSGVRGSGSHQLGSEGGFHMRLLLRSRSLRKLVLAASLFMALTLGAPSSASAQTYLANVDSYNMTCAFYTETSGACIEEVIIDGVRTLNWYFFIGNWWIQVA
jgi:hypothetical protein